MPIVRVAALAEIEASRGFEVSSITQTRFPLKFSGAVMADSRDDLRLQLADLLAGGLRLSAEMLRGIKPNDGFPEALVSGFGDESVIFNLPTLDFGDIRDTFKGADGAKSIDFLAREFAKHNLKHSSE